MSNNPEIFGDTQFKLHMPQLQNARNELACEIVCAQELVDYPDEDISDIGRLRLEAVMPEARVYMQRSDQVFQVARAIYDRGTVLELNGYDNNQIVEILLKEIPHASAIPRLLRKTDWGQRLVTVMGRIAAKKSS